MIRRRRLHGAVLFSAGWVLLIVLALLARSHAGVAEPSAAEVCASPPVLQHSGGISLVPDAMAAFHKAERLAGRTIHVVQSYRSCADQRLACQRICGDAGGCPGTCAPAGLSWHNRGEAVDLATSSLHDPRVVSAMRTAGWCESVPDNDPGHFSFGGCH